MVEEAPLGASSGVQIQLVPFRDTILWVIVLQTGVAEGHPFVLAEEVCQTSLVPNNRRPTDCPLSSDRTIEMHSIAPILDARNSESRVLLNELQTALVAPVGAADGYIQRDERSNHNSNNYTDDHAGISFLP